MPRYREGDRREHRYPAQYAQCNGKAGATGQNDQHQSNDQPKPYRQRVQPPGVQVHLQVTQALHRTHYDKNTGKHQKHGKQLN